MQNNFMNICSDDMIMTLSGKGQIAADPDIATIRLGVETIGLSLSEIQSENARISQAVLQSLQQYDIYDFNTAQYTINKIYEYENNQRIDKGYSVRNILEIKMQNLNQVGFVIDDAVANGANVVEFIEFGISDSSGYYLQALDLAVKDALNKANAVANSLNVIVDYVPRHVTETSTLPIFPQSTLAREASFVTPIVPGSKLIEASVTIEFEYYKYK